MRDIREIAIIIQSARQSIGSTVSILRGIKKDSTTPYGSLQTDFDIERVPPSIRSTISDMARKAEEITEEPEEEIIVEKYKNLVDQFIDLYNTNQNSLKNLRIPTDKAPAIQKAVERLYAKDYLDIDDMNEVLKEASGNQNPFEMGEELIYDGTYKIKQSCAGSGFSCAGETSGDSIADVIWGWISKNIGCAIAMFYHLVMTVLIKPIVMTISMVQNMENKIARLGMALVIAYPFGIIPALGPLLSASVLAMLLSDKVYGFIARHFYCPNAIKSGMTDDVYEQVCVMDIPSSDYIYIVEIEQGETTTTHGYTSIAFDVDTPELESNYTVETMLGDDSSITEYSGKLVEIVEYNAFKFRPYYIQYDIDEDDINADTAIEMLTGEVVLDSNDQPEFDNVLDDTDTSTCVADTQSVALFIMMKMGDMMLTPGKYGLLDPVDIVMYSMIQQNSSMVTSVGEMLKQTAKSTDVYDEINGKVKELHGVMERSYEDVQNRFNDMIGGIENMKSVRSDLGAIHNPVLNEVIDALTDIFYLHKEYITKDQGVQIICCFLGEYINQAIDKLNEKGEQINLDNIIDEINAILDATIKATELGIRLSTTDYEATFKMMIQNGLGGILTLLLTIYGQVYSFIRTGFQDWFGSKMQGDETWKRCLPWVIVQQLINRLIDSMLNIFVETSVFLFENLSSQLAVNQSFQGKMAALSLGGTVIKTLKSMKVRLADFKRCINIEPDFNNDGVSDFTAYNPGDTSNFDPETEINSRSTEDIGIPPESVLMWNASVRTGLSIYMDKKKLQDTISTLTNEDVDVFQEQKNSITLFENLDSDNDNLMTLSEILKYYESGGQQ